MLSWSKKFFLVWCFSRKNEKETGSSYLSQRLLGSSLEMCYSAIWGIFRSSDLAATRTLKKKSTGLISKTILHVHHTFLYISLPFLHDYDVKISNFSLMQDVNKQRPNLFPILNLDRKNANSLFKQRSRCRRVVGS